MWIATSYRKESYWDYYHVYTFTEKELYLNTVYYYYKIITYVEHEQLESPRMYFICG